MPKRYLTSRQLGVEEIISSPYVYERGGRCVSLHALPNLVARSGVSYVIIDSAQVGLYLLPSSWQRKYLCHSSDKDENVLRFSARLDDGVPEVNFDLAVPG